MSTAFLAVPFDRRRSNNRLLLNRERGTLGSKFLHLLLNQMHFDTYIRSFSFLCVKYCIMVEESQPGVEEHGHVLSNAEHGHSSYGVSIAVFCSVMFFSFFLVYGSTWRDKIWAECDLIGSYPSSFYDRTAW